jgi:glycosyltransferase involved in cell wall biosynthesis
VRRQLGVDANAFALGFVGYMRPWHRLDLVLEAMAMPGLERLHLVLMGQGPALPGLVATAQARGLGGRLHMAGEVPPESLPQHVLACDATLVPAINPYASPLKLFDSLAAGVVALVPDQPNLHEIIVHGQNGLVFTPGDAAAMAAVLRPLLADPGLARALGERGRASLLANAWTWEGNADRVASIFAELRQGRVA